MLQPVASPADPVQDLPALLVGKLLKTLQSSLHGSGIMRLDHLFHPFFGDVGILLVGLAELCVHTAGDALLMMKQTQQMLGSGKNLSNGAHVALQSIRDNQRRELTKTFEFQQK